MSSTKNSAEAEAIDATANFRRSLQEIGAAENIQTVQAFLITVQLGTMVRKSYSMKKSESEKMFNNFAHAMAQIDPAYGAMVDGFINGWNPD